MPPKKKQATRGRRRGGGKGRTAMMTAPPSSPPSDSSSRHSSPAGGGGADAPASTKDCPRSPTPPHGSRDGSPHGSRDGSPRGCRDGSPVSSVHSSGSDQPQRKKQTKKTGPKKTRAKKTDNSLSPADEGLMLEFIVENPMLWDKRLIDYRNPSKKAKLWEEQATQMGKDGFPVSRRTSTYTNLRVTYL